MRVLLLALLVGCESDPYASGRDEPIRVREGVFHLGELPVNSEATTPVISNAGGVGAVVTAGQSSISYNGLASADTYSVAVAFPGLGTGYWVVPASGPDVTANNQLIFSLTADFSADVPAGLQQLTFVPIDGAELPGPAYESTVCVLPEVANNNLAACDPATSPQSAVYSLTWDTDVDLDLIVVAPNGKVVSSKTPTTLIKDGTTPIPTGAINDPATGSITRDSNANCEIDGIRRESLVFIGEPPAGEYQFYVSFRAACGRSYVNFDLTQYRRVDAEDGTHPVEQTALAAGELVALQADGGASLGTRLTTLTVP